jgi:hypothetical protein
MSCILINLFGGVLLAASFCSRRSCASLCWNKKSPGTAAWAAPVPSRDRGCGHCAQLEPNRTALALHCFGLAGFETYEQQLREAAPPSCRKITITPPLFPGYAFVMIVSGWWNARWSPGVVRLIMDGLLHGWSAAGACS